MNDANGLISNCPLCEEHSLHVVGQKDTQVMQCINCGYVSSTKFTGNKETNEEYKKLPEDMKSWAVEKNNRKSRITNPHWIKAVE